MCRGRRSVGFAGTKQFVNIDNNHDDDDDDSADEKALIVADHSISGCLADRPYCLFSVWSIKHPELEAGIQRTS